MATVKIKWRYGPGTDLQRALSVQMFRLSQASHSMPKAVI